MDQIKAWNRVPSQAQKSWKSYPCCLSLMLTSLGACNQSEVFQSQIPLHLAQLPGHAPSCICQQPVELVSHSYANLHLNCRSGQ